MSYYFEDFAPGRVFFSQRRTVSEADLVVFAGWSWDTNPVHTDADAAAEGRFGGRIAHGLLGMSLAMGLASRTGVFEECSIALLGVDRWRFHKPVLIGDTLRCSVEIASTRLTSRGDAGILERTFSLLNQRDDIVQEGDIALMVSLRPTQQHE